MKIPPFSKNESARLMSPCCKAPVNVYQERDDYNGPFGAFWYECSQCGDACDPIVDENAEADNG